MSDNGFTGRVNRLLSAVGVGSEFTLTQLNGGANNRVFRVDTGAGSYLLKSYFRHVEDPRDRLTTEYSFMRFAWDNGIRCIPEPIACSNDDGIALYDFIQGEKPEPSHITEREVSQAVDFYKDLNHLKQEKGAKNLPIGSEACFSVSEHLQCVSKRVARLRTVKDSSEVNGQAVRFIARDLSDAWETTADAIAVAAQTIGVSPDQEIVADDRCLSPSDFGFHNALVASDGNLRFIDFEYAGWDDPAKMVCDFFCQPAIPLPPRYRDLFIERATSGLPDPGLLRRRIALLLPAYMIKWCCILLNDFLPIGRKRRDFAIEGAGEMHKERQLQKARLMLAALHSRKIETWEKKNDG